MDAEGRRVAHDPEKWRPVFRKDHAQNITLFHADDEQARETQEHLAVTFGRIGLGDALLIGGEIGLALRRIQRIDIGLEPRAFHPFDDALRTIKGVFIDRMPDIDPRRMGLELLLIGMW